MKDELVSNAGDNTDLEELRKENKKLSIELMARSKKIAEWRRAYQQPLMKDDDIDKKKDKFYVHNQTNNNINKGDIYEEYQMVI